MIRIEELRRELAQRSGWHLVSGRVLADVPHGAAELPAELGGAVLARLDVEERAPFGRPILTRSDLGRDFWLDDGSGRALVRVGHGGHLHPDVELRLDAPFVEIPNEDGEEDEEGFTRITYVRTLRTGDPVYVWGRPALSYAPSNEDAGYRDSALTVEFSPRGVIHLYDQPAWTALVAWRALPWYRKLSVLMRNR